jgi:hypothetical protein
MHILLSSLPSQTKPKLNELHKAGPALGSGVIAPGRAENPATEDPEVLACSLPVTLSVYRLQTTRKEGPTD